MTKRKMLSVKKAKVSTLKKMSCRKLRKRLTKVKRTVERLDTPFARRKLPSIDRRLRKGIALSEASKTIKALKFKRCST